jgi:hypothetical protein
VGESDGVGLAAVSLTEFVVEGDKIVGLSKDLGLEIAVGALVVGILVDHSFKVKDAVGFLVDHSSNVGDFVGILVDHSSNVGGEVFGVRVDRSSSVGGEVVGALVDRSSNVGDAVTEGSGKFVGARVGRNNRTSFSVGSCVGMNDNTSLPVGESVGVELICFVGAEEGAFVTRD